MKLSITIFLLSTLVLSSCGSSKKPKYTSEDWEVYNACKETVFENKDNEYNYSACKEMLSHKKALKKYGAYSSYNYWLNRLSN